MREKLRSRDHNLEFYHKNAPIRNKHYTHNVIETNKIWQLPRASDKVEAALNIRKRRVLMLTTKIITSDILSPNSVYSHYINSWFF